MDIKEEMTLMTRRIENLIDITESHEPLCEVYLVLQKVIKYLDRVKGGF